MPDDPDPAARPTQASTPEPAPPTVKDALGVAKDVFHVLREAILVLVVGLLLFAPGCVKASLVGAGFTRASFAGLEMNLIEESAEEAASALEAVDAVQAQSDSVLQALDAVAAETDDPEVQRQVAQAITRVEETAIAAEVAGATLVDQLERQQTVLAAAPRREVSEATVQRVDSVLAERTRMQTIRARPIRQIDGPLRQP